jgi:ribosomal protein S18 acetylase RimI-like enzyme
MAQKFNLEDITFKRLEPAALDTDEWRMIQEVMLHAFSLGLPKRSKHEIQNLVKWNRTREFINSRYDPRAGIASGEFFPDQSYRNPLVTVACEGQRTIGYAYSADNTSGASEWRRQLKMWTPGGAHRYGWLREIAVEPSHQQRGIGRMLVYLSLDGRSHKQPASAYIWSEENNAALRFFTGLGYEAQGNPNPPTVFPFGREFDGTHLSRLVAPHIGTVLDHVRQLPDADAAIFDVNSHLVQGA